MNNITAANYEDKVAKAKVLLEPQYFEWFANYLVATQANYHPVYYNYEARRQGAAQAGCSRARASM